MVDLFARRGGDPGRPGKRHPLDCVLWQAERPDEPAWDTPLGHGRPGWHIECVAIALDHLGSDFDVQGGGSDLAFPHHEMCAAQAGSATGEPLAGHYVHTGMVGYDGEKMSKSRGNLVFVSGLRRAGADPAAIRLALLTQHYRSDWEWTPAHLDAGQQRLARWRSAARIPGPGLGTSGLLAAVRARLADDLDAPGALAAADDWAAARLAGVGDPRSLAGGPPFAAIVDSLLGITL